MFNFTTRVFAVATISITGLLVAAAKSDAQVTVSYTGPAVAIPDNNATGVNIPLVVNGVGGISDLNFRFDTIGPCTASLNNSNAAVTHTFVGDLIFKLTSPAGTSKIIMNRRGGTRENICATTLDDDGGAPSLTTLTTVSGTPVSGTFSSEGGNALTAFDGENANGTWILNVSDNAGVDTGNVLRFSLIFSQACAPLTCPANLTVVNAAGTCAKNVSFPAMAASPACGTVTCSATSGASFPVGTSTVNCQAPAANRSCSFTVKVVDNEPPVVVCSGPVSTSTTNEVGAPITFANATVMDNCPGSTAAQCDRTSGSVFPVGSTTVSCSSTDAAGITGSCAFAATVNGGANVDILSGSKPTCSKGASITKATLVIKNIGGTVGDESVSLTGSTKFKNSTYAKISGRKNGAQIHLEDSGNGKATLYELSERTSLVSAGAVGVAPSCGTDDGWVRNNSYVNNTNKLSGQLCLDKSANGLSDLSLGAPKGSGKLSPISFTTRGSRLFQASVKGPLVATVVFGSNAQGAVGQCAVAKFKAARCVKRGSKLTCRN